MTSRNLVNNNLKPSFKQQNLPACQPILTAGTVLPTFFLIGVAFVPIGIGLLTASNNVQEYIKDYTDCHSINFPNRTCASIAERSINQAHGCQCKLEIELTHDFKQQVYVYYGLSNFYQNHRRYVKSRDDGQLLGNPLETDNDCIPFKEAKDPNDGKMKPIAPCGAIANSKFNDTFELKSPDGAPVHMSRIEIAWPSDKRIRFRNPELKSDDLTGLAEAFNGTVKPPYWPKPVYQLHPGDNDYNGFQNEDLIVWMRTAALPTFRKLYGWIKPGNDDSGNSLSKGSYSVIINYNYPVTAFNGRKRFIISDTSWLGGKNPFLGIAYIVVGCACFLLSAFFLFIHKKYGMAPSDMTQINQTTPYLSSHS